MATPPSQRAWHVTPAPVRAGGAVIGLTVLVALICIAFGWPAARANPHNLPLGLAGQPAAVDRIGNQLDLVAPGGFAVTTYPDEEALRSAIRNREVYGGLVAGRQETLLLTASGASPTVAQLLTLIGADIAMHAGTPLRTDDLAELPADDRRGAGLAASALPLTLAGLLPGIVLLVVFPRQTWLQFVATTVFSVLAAATVTVLLRQLLGSIDQNSFGVAAGLTLGILAMSLSVLGLGAVFGWIGLGAGIAVAVLLGNPLSGLMSAPEMLPRGWGALGQLLPQGANATLLRSTAYFSGAGATTAILVLTGWAVAGVLLIGIAGLRSRA